MRIVVATVEPPDPFGNAAARWYYVLFRGLTERGHDVTMLSTYVREESRDRALERFPASRYDLRCFPVVNQRTLASKLRSGLRPYSYMFSTQFSQETERVLRQPFDVLHLEQLWTGWVGWEHADRALLHVHYLYSADLLGVPPSGLRDRARRLSTFRAERAILKHYPFVSTLSGRLVDDIRRISSRTASIIPLGLDPSLYEFSEEDPSGPLTLGLVGNFSWQPTHRAGVRLLRELWPEISARLPDLQLLLVGRDAERLMRSHARGPRIEIHENVPDIVPYFRRIHALLYAPSHGSGTKVKVQESLALGVPVVTNTDGAEGIPAIDGNELGLADDNPGLIERTLELLNSPALRRERRRRGHALVSTAFAPAHCLTLLERSYQALLAGSAPTQSAAR